MTKKIKKILIANRGEIAVRVMRTCREMGIKTVAVYSEADQNALYVKYADEAHLLGPAPASESYLCIDKIIAIAKKSSADAIHPGYGFLSEKAAFSEACEKAGLVFLGPTPQAILAMGDKVTARTHAKKAGVPMVPGTLDPVADLEEIKKLAKEFGYPVLLKAAAGGGGKGMRVVNNESEIESSFSQAASEALKSFGDSRMYLEKYVKNPRHVEAQIIGDTHGQVFFLLERECSMQRRHQKVIEEAPCAYLKDDVREKIAAAAISLAKSIGYTGVGTLEFLVDDAQNFYFLEMNTRLQVEHCVTEMITGLDLVRLQILVGAGEKLALPAKITPQGHAIECRIYAEDPETGFMPSPGKIHFLQAPEGPGIRHDSGVATGSEISIYYDPMIAKLITHAQSRDQAIQKMLSALCDYKILGPKNNIAFIKTLLATPEFTQQQMHTQLIDQHPEWCKAPEKKDLPWAVILAATALSYDVGARHAVPAPASNDDSLWWQSGLEVALR